MENFQIIKYLEQSISVSNKLCKVEQNNKNRKIKTFYSFAQSIEIQN